MGAWPLPVGLLCGGPRTGAEEGWEEEEEVVGVAADVVVLFLCLSTMM